LREQNYSCRKVQMTEFIPKLNFWRYLCMFKRQHVLSPISTTYFRYSSPNKTTLD
jgi:hypothetical protein